MGKRIATAMLTIALTLAPAASAWAAGEITVIYGGGQAVARTLELDGQAYELSDWSAAGAADAATKTFEKAQEQTVAAADYTGDAAAAFPATLMIDEEGFKGEIPLASATAAAGKSHENRTDYEVVDTFTNLTQKELDALPEQRTVEAGGRKLTLKKLDVDAERMPSDPETAIYEGSVTYGIHEGTEVAEEYTLTAVYRGDLTRAADTGTVTAVYKPTTTAAVADATSAKRAREEQEAARQAQSEQQAAAQQAATAQQSESSIPLAVVGGALVALLAIGVAWTVGRKLGIVNEQEAAEGDEVASEGAADPATPANDEPGVLEMVEAEADERQEETWLE